MSETRWYYGYQCEVGTEASEWGLWYGQVNVPRCHPVRNDGLDDLLVLACHRCMWTVFLEGKTHLGVMTAVQVAASRLRRMQDEWDRLSPYEREYRIW